MKQKDTPAGEQELILALAAGATVREAAEKSGIGERTVYRRLAEAAFRRAVKEARGRMFDSAVGQLAGLTSKATETLQRLMESDKPSEALGAAKAVLELGPRLRRATELEERICGFEDDDDWNEPSADEQELVEALAAGATTRQAAERTGIDEQTVHHRLTDPDFRRAVSRARGQMFDAAHGRLTSLAGKATGIFGRLMVSEQPSVARRAAKAVLELGPRLREATEVAERITRLEKEADERDAERANGNQTAIIIDKGWYGEAST
jgi:putative ubiquitin-RnfH superfamily antitoxin RatB of RatAB toxin-antitoxin module